MATFNHYQLILDELKGTLSHVKDEEFDGFASEVTEASRIFVAGKGRSGFVANSFAMRLNQLGKQAFVIGESTTPSIQKGDLFIVISGSGSTEHLQVVLLTTKLDSAIGEIADTVVELPAGTKHDATGSDQPLGSLFEQSSQIFLDSVVIGLMTQLDVDETTMQNNHANLE
ncbi:MAG: 6-phospho-3-hexuloisomerase [Staphylococcus epidermidis]|nr:6-phospho-3-hexuloisomerase [Staphylococcus epidermidis]